MCLLLDYTDLSYPILSYLNLSDLRSPGKAQQRPCIRHWSARQLQLPIYTRQGWNIQFCLIVSVVSVCLSLPPSVSLPISPFPYFKISLYFRLSLYFSLPIGVRET